MNEQRLERLMRLRVQAEVTGKIEIALIVEALLVEPKARPRA
jgi:hypothetical protein